METATSKSEILKGLKELKEKGVGIVMHNSFIDRNERSTLSINSGSFVSYGQNCHQDEHADVIVNVKTIRQANDLSVHIYQNSSEDEVKTQITSIQNHLDRIARESKTTAIVDFLKEELFK